jgi:S-adenosylhomocysteine hydrolase
MGTLAALAILQQSLTMASQVSALIATAHAEKRDVTMEELNGLAAADDVAKAALDAAIQKAKS